MDDKVQEGEGNPITFHLGCDPRNNQEKWMANQWIRNKRVQLPDGRSVLFDEEW